MTVNKAGLKNAVLAYKNKSHEGFSKDKIKTDLKAFFSEYNVNASNFLTISPAPDSGLSISTYLDKLSDVIYKKEQMKLKAHENPKNKKEHDKPNQNPEETERKHKKPFSISSKELINWNDNEIKPKLIEKMLGAGYTIEELNAPSYTPISLTVPSGTNLDVNITPGKSLIDRQTEFVRKIKHALEHSQTLEEVFSDISKEDKKQGLEEPVDEEKNQDELDDEPEQNEEESASPDEETDSPEEDNDLTPEDLEDIANYGIEGITSHSKMEEFRKSEEWEQIQSMQENALSRYDD